jgi:hypothetical protein
MYYKIIENFLIKQLTNLVHCNILYIIKIEEDEMKGIKLNGNEKETEAIVEINKTTTQLKSGRELRVYIANNKVYLEGTTNSVEVLDASEECNALVYNSSTNEKKALTITSNIKWIIALLNTVKKENRILIHNLTGQLYNMSTELNQRLGRTFEIDNIKVQYLYKN